jgi:hypothetical protein
MRDENYAHSWLSSGTKRLQAPAGDAKKAVSGAAITITVKTTAGKSGQVRFKP